MTPLGSAASNVFNMLNMMFFLTFCTEALNLNVVVVGVVMTAMRLFDGITDPIIGNIIDRTETRFGKFRPFLVDRFRDPAGRKLCYLCWLFCNPAELPHGVGRAVVRCVGHWLHLHDHREQVRAVCGHQEPQDPVLFPVSPAACTAP